MNKLNILFLFIFSMSVHSSYAQKLTIDTSTYRSWPTTKSPQITNDGLFFAYLLDSANQHNVLVVKSTTGSWEKKFTLASNGLYSFTDDSKFVVFKRSQDSVGILRLDRHELAYLSGVNSFKISSNEEQAFLGYINQNSELIIKDLNNNTSESYLDAIDFKFNKPDQILLVTSDMTIMQVNIAHRVSHTIDKDSSAKGFAFDESGSQLAFSSEKNFGENKIRIIKYYKSGMDAGKAIAVKQLAQFARQNLKISDNSFFFSHNGEKLFFYLERSPEICQNCSPHNSHLVIWNYKDSLLQSEQLADDKKRYLCVINLSDDDKIIKLENDSCLLTRNESIMGNNSKNLLAYQYDDYRNEHNNTAIFKRVNYEDLLLISTDNGSRSMIKKHLIGGRSRGLSEISTGGKYVIWFDREKANWFSYGLAGKKTVCITSKIKEPLTFENDRPSLAEEAGILGWESNDKSVFIYDRYDIWKIDPQGISNPINITNGYGKRNKTILRGVTDNSDFKIYPEVNKDVILKAFNEKNIDQGFYIKNLNRKCDPTYLTMGPYSYNDNFYDAAYCRAKFANVYVVKRMSASEYPNYFITNDFANFKRLSNFDIQKSYNWYSSNLVKWKIANGQVQQGILYKPENFSPNKKYPVIIYYYEKSSFLLNSYLPPGLSDGLLNIPYFVSNGYLVFVPDINFKLGYPGRSAYNTVISATKQLLLNRKYIDPQHIGLYGHSYGAYLTNYIITRSHLFAAAISAAGFSDIIKDYGDICFNQSKHFYYEQSQGRIGTSLWQNTGLYIKNSPIFQAPSVTTPLLMLNNTLDENVLWSQGFEWYTALRSLKKKVWMLEYDNERHTIHNLNNKVDYSIRIAQFFDYYLKNKPAPIWMTRGILASERDMNTGLELDMSSERP